MAKKSTVKKPAKIKEVKVEEVSSTEFVEEANETVTDVKNEELTEVVPSTEEPNDVIETTNYRDLKKVLGRKKTLKGDIYIGEKR